MKLVKFISAFLTFTGMLLFFSNTVKADIMPPPTDIFWTPFTLGVFAGNLIINFIIFGIAYLIFVERNVHNINKKSFLITIFLITTVGFFADSVALNYTSSQQVIIVFIMAAFLIFILDFLICKYYLKLTTKKSTILAIWMAILTNPFFYILITGLLSILLPSPPYNPIRPPTS